LILAEGSGFRPITRLSACLARPVVEVRDGERMNDVTPPAASEPDFYAERAAERAFPSRLPPPSTGGGAELGELVTLYATEPRPFPTPNPGPAAPPPVVASGPGSRVGWLLRGRRGRAEGEGA